MKSLSASNEFSSIKECIDWANSLSDSYKLPVTNISIIVSKQQWDNDKQKYVKRDKEVYVVSCSLRKDSYEYDL